MAFKEQSSEHSCSNFIIFMSIFSAFNAIVLLFYSYFAIRVLRLYKFKNRWLLLYLTILFISIVSNITYGLENVIARRKHGIEEITHGSFIIFSWMSFVFNLLTVFINLFNWVFQIINVNEKISSKKIDKTIPWVVFYALFSFFLILYFSFITAGGMKTQTIKIFTLVVNYIYSVAFIFVGGAFPIVGLKFIKKYQIIEPNKSKRIKRLVSINVTIIAIIYIARGAYLIIRTIFNFEEKLIENGFESNNISYPIYQFFYGNLASTIPSVLHILMIRNLVHMHDLSASDKEKAQKDLWSFVDHINTESEGDFSRHSHNRLMTNSDF